MPVADTSFIVDLIRKDPGAVARFEQFEDEGIALQTTGITALELYKGAFLSGNEENNRKVDAILELFTVIPVDEMVYETFGRIAGTLASQGDPIGDFDEVIAAIALLYDSEIITKDRHFSKVPGLRALSW